jgi:hypothetical protein
MKLVRWTLAGASFYVIYKYTIGKKAAGEDVFAHPEPEEQAAGQVEATPKPKAKRARKPRAKA